MLNYQFNNKDIHSDNYDINIDHFEISNLTNVLSDDMIVTIYYNNTNFAIKDDNIRFNGVYTYHDESINKDYVVGEEFKKKVESYSIEKKSFSIYAPKYKKLNLKDLYETCVDNVLYWNFVFVDSHFFTREETATIYITYNNSTIKITDVIVETHNVLSWKVELGIPDIEAIRNRVMVDETSTRTHLGIESIKSKDITGLYVKRDQILFTDSILNSNVSHLSANVMKYNVGILVPIELHSDTNLEQNELLQEYFVNEETGSCINAPVELERYCYIPVNVYKDANTDKEVFVPVQKINYNIHMRIHSGDNWVVEQGSLWNFVNYSSGGFPYQNKSNQPDLLSHLGFTNKEVKYQKNVLKKSFLRCSVFDTMNSANQDLLCYSTIFVDSGRLYGKYISHSEMTSKCYHTPDNKLVNYIGVDNEIDKVYVSNLDDVEIEKYRLGAQLTISDRYESKSSSEGFYLYLWNDNDRYLTPSSACVQLEFNHAKYSRVIPFMMPYWDSKKDNHTPRFKTNDEIITDWTTPTILNPNGGYDIKQYTRYSYLHIKYQFDKDNNRHVYYLDPDYYGYSNSNVININLYEANITF